MFICVILGTAEVVRFFPRILRIFICSIYLALALLLEGCFSMQLFQLVFHSDIETSHSQILKLIRPLPRIKNPPPLCNLYELYFGNIYWHERLRINLLTPMRAVWKATSFSKQAKANVLFYTGRHCYGRGQLKNGYRKTIWWRRTYHFWRPSGEISRFFTQTIWNFLERPRLPCSSYKAVFNCVVKPGTKVITLTETQGSFTIL